jgi:hypothetical protein
LKRCKLKEVVARRPQRDGETSKSNDDATSGRLHVSTPYFGTETYSLLQRNPIRLSEPIIYNLITVKGKNKGRILII